MYIYIYICIYICIYIYKSVIRLRISCTVNSQLLYILDRRLNRSLCLLISKCTRMYNNPK